MSSVGVRSEHPTATRAGPARPLLERDGELAALQGAVAAARAGEGRLVVIEGSAGIGKSSLLAESRAIASDAGMRVLGARAGEREAEFAFGVVRQLFEQPLVDASVEQRAELLAGAAELVEPLFPAFQPQPPPVLADSPFAIQYGLYWLAANMAYLQPTCLIVDDLHWADRPSLQWLGTSYVGWRGCRSSSLPLRELPRRPTTRHCSMSSSPTRQRRTSSLLR
jgi:hypothetical protein